MKDLGRRFFMAWQARSIMSQRAEFVALARVPGANHSRLCERFGISRQTGYTWLKRGVAGEPMSDRSRRPASSPGKTGPEEEKLIVALRDKHPAWGARKLRARLEQQGHTGLPSVSTITAVLHRHGRITAEASEAAQPWTRFEHERPNDLWQMDFKGPIATRGGECHALTVLDDHSRYSLGLRACPDQRGVTVKAELTRMFETYGLPWKMLADNGSPWGVDASGAWTRIGVWLLKLGVVLVHGRPYHPQTQGKEERFHRTLQAELLRRADFKSTRHAQSLMDPWRDVYNLERPHEAVGLKPPVTRYVPSVRSMPRDEPKMEPTAGQHACVVKEGGTVRYKGERWFLGLAWDQETVGLKRRESDGVLEVYFGPYHIAELEKRKDANDHGVRLIPLARCAAGHHHPHLGS
jgi:transposase InsO family protein